MKCQPCLAGPDPLCEKAKRQKPPISAFESYKRGATREHRNIFVVGQWVQLSHCITSFSLLDTYREHKRALALRKREINAVNNASCFRLKCWNRCQDEMGHLCLQVRMCWWIISLSAAPFSITGRQLCLKRCSIFNGVTSDLNELALYWAAQSMWDSPLSFWAGDTVGCSVVARYVVLRTKTHVLHKY